METQVRLFGQLTADSPDDLVPRDHFYHHLERSLDLAFVRDLVQPCHAAGGEPSVDPVVFFQLQLIMFFTASTLNASVGSALALPIPMAVTVGAGGGRHRICHGREYRGDRERRLVRLCAPSGCWVEGQLDITQDFTVGGSSNVSS